MCNFSIKHFKALPQHVSQLIYKSKFKTGDFKKIINDFLKKNKTMLHG